MSEEKMKQDDVAPAAAPEKHDDEAQDVELIKKMLKKYMGDDVQEASEEECGIAKEALEAYKEMGYSEEEAEEAAAHAVKLAKHMAGKAAAAPADEKAPMPAEQEEAGQPSPAQLKPEAKKESEESEKVESMRNEIIQLKGELSAFKEAARKGELATYLDEKMAKTKLSGLVTKGFKESLKELKSKEQIDQAWDIYSAGFKSGGAVARQINFTEAHQPEKTIAVGNKASMFEGIIK
jgi:hypothetical protein